MTSLVIFPEQFQLDADHALQPGAVAQVKPQLSARAEPGFGRQSARPAQRGVQQATRAEPGVGAEGILPLPLCSLKNKDARGSYDESSS